VGVPRLSVLEPSEIETVDRATRDLLARGGVDVHSPLARELLTAVGAESIAGGVRVRIPDSVVTDALRQAPREVLLASRNGQNDLRVPDGASHVSTDGCGVNVWDLMSGERRPSTQNDLAELTRVADALEEVDLQWPMVVAGDVPVEVHELTELAVTFENTTKHVQHEALSAAEARTMVDMAAIVAGGEGELRRRPILSSVQCPVSPLTLEGNSTDAMIVLNRSGIPVAPLSMVLVGGSSPVDLASALVVSNAEILASICVAQAAAPRTPVLWAIASGPIDMRTGSFAAGSPELGLLNAAGVEMARHYGLPTLVAGFSCDADSVGVQAGVEKLGTGLPAMLAGADLISGVGGLDSDSCMSLEQLALDSEIVGYARRTLEGLSVRPETVHLDTLLRLGPQGNFLKERHTLANFRKTIWNPRLFHRDGFVEGSPAEQRVRQRAVARVRELLRDHIPERLPRDLRAAMRETAGLPGPSAQSAAGD
jgi:trimethylamine---corrinoid protein Co-methyltransferase